MVERLVISTCLTVDLSVDLNAIIDRLFDEMIPHDSPECLNSLGLEHPWATY